MIDESVWTSGNIRATNFDLDDDAIFIYFYQFDTVLFRPSPFNHTLKMEFSI